MKSLFPALILVLFFALPAFSADAAPSTAPSGASALAPTASAPTSSSSNRKTSLSFDNAVVEGMNSNSLNSAENIGANDGVNQHLYRLRKDFKDQTPGLIRELGYSE